MISLEQVRALESRVEKAVALIASLRTENASLRSGLATADSRVAELEALVAEFQKDQARIEAGIIEALRKLDSFEDSVHESVSTKAAGHPVSEKPAQDGPAPRSAKPAVQESAQNAAQVASEDTAPVDEEPVADGADALDLF